MRAYWRLTLAGGILLGSITGLSTASPVAKAGTASDPAAALKASYGYTKYLCQKWYNGHWCTVYSTYSYDDAMDWYGMQDGNARVVAQVRQQARGDPRPPPAAGRHMR